MITDKSVIFTINSQQIFTFKKQEQAICNIFPIQMTKTVIPLSEQLTTNFFSITNQLIKTGLFTKLRKINKHSFNFCTSNIKTDGKVSSILEAHTQQRENICA